MLQWARCSPSCSRGVILVTKYAGQADIDADCVLHGELAFVPLQQTTLFGLRAPALYGHCLCFLFYPSGFLAWL